MGADQRLKQLQRALKEAVQAVERAEQHVYPPHVVACLRACEERLHQAHQHIQRAIQAMSK